MKKINLILALILGIAVFLGSCKKESKDPVMDISSSTAPAISSPASGADIVLTLADSAKAMKFEWSAASYSITDGVSLPLPTYSLLMVLKDTVDIEKELYNTQDLAYETIVYDLNNQLIAMGIPGDSTRNVELRVVSEIPGVQSSVIVSEVTTVKYTTFKSADPPPVGPPLYLIGDATDIGWDNTNISLPFTYIPELDIYEIVAYLSGGGKYIKAFEVQGQWAPQWGTDEAGTAETGILVYRPTEDVPDPAAIPSPEEPGLYKITFDLTNTVYTVEPFEQSMHIIGDATEAGWDNSVAVPMVAVGVGQFELVTTLSSDATEGFKFLVNQGEWAPMYGTTEGAAFESGVLVYRETESDPDPKSIPPPAATGTYLIEMDINEMVYTVTPQ